MENLPDDTVGSETCKDAKSTRSNKWLERAKKKKTDPAFQDNWFNLFLQLRRVSTYNPCEHIKFG